VRGLVWIVFGVTRRFTAESRDRRLAGGAVDGIDRLERTVRGVPEVEACKEGPVEDAGLLEDEVWYNVADRLLD